MNEKITIDQHIIPASYIGLFGKERPKKMRSNKIFVSFKGSEPFPKKAEGILSEDYFYEINQNNLLQSGYIPNIIENNLRQIEDNYLKIIKSIELGHTINPKENNVIIEYMCQIHKRGRSFRELIEKRLRDSGVSKSEEMAKNITSLSLIFEREELQSDFEKKIGEYTFDTCTANENNFFLSSDNPVIYGEECILFPLSSEKCLVGFKGKKKFLSVELINTAIASCSNNMIFGPNENLIQNYKKYIGNPDLLILKHLDKDLSPQEILTYL